MKARENPFSTHRVLRVRFHPQGAQWEELMERLNALQHRAAIVGPHGSGKTTLLEDLAERLQAAGSPTLLVRLDMIAPSLSLRHLRDISRRLAAATMLLVDGADLLPAWQWFVLKLLSRRGAGLIITSHRTGLLPTLHQSRTSPELLRQVVTEIITPDPLPPTVDVEQLYATHHGNLRDALRGLYDQYAQRDRDADRYNERR